MKIDASLLLAPEKDAGPRGARTDAADRDAGQAFGAAVKSVGDKAAGHRAKGASADPKAHEAMEGDEDAKPSADQGDASSATATASSFDLRALVSALVKTEATPSEDDAAGDAKAATANQGTAPADDADDTTAASRLPRVRILRTETHFEPRMEGALTEDTGTAATGVQHAAAEGSDPAAEAARQLRGQSETARHVATGDMMSAAGTSRNTSGGDAEPATRPTMMPVRFDEALARLAQGNSASGGDAGAGGREKGRENAGRRVPGERTEPATGGSRLEARAEVAIAKASKDGDAGGTGAIPGLALQVASRIADALGSGPANGTGQQSNAPADGAEGSHFRMRAGGAALKTLTIQLQPEHLGTLEVSMRLRDGKLAIELAASKPEAATALAQDRETLRKVLESAGFSIDDAALTVTTREAPTLRAADTASSNGETGGGQAGASSGDPSGTRGEAGRREGATERNAGREGEANSRPTAMDTPFASRAAGQTYL